MGNELSSEWRLKQATQKFLGDKASQTFYCEICYVDHSKEQIAYLECGHFYCRDGLKEYFDYMITQSGVSYKLKCPDSKCTAEIDRD